MHRLILALFLLATFALAPALAHAPTVPVVRAQDDQAQAIGVADGDAQDDSASSLQLAVTGSPLLPGAPVPIQVTVTLQAPAELRLRVVDFDGQTVAELYRGRRKAGDLQRAWSGVTTAGQSAPPGPYRVVATSTLDGRLERAETWVALADRAVYPEAPASITVAVDPGHGGDYDGAVAPDGTREADINLDIGLRLAHMLEGAGVHVVLTRAADRNVNEPPEDRTGDRLIDRDDELAARPDAANEARADLFISIHNNSAASPRVGGPSTLYFDERPFAARNARLAKIVQEEMLAGLAEAGADGWQPHDHGALIYPYYVLRGFDPPRLRRPTQMPGVLSEGLFLSNPQELALLQQPAVRGAMAAAYYRAVARYLSRRGPHLRYALVDGPAEAVEPGRPLTLGVEVRNQGSEAVRDWRLTGELERARPRYLGRVGRGTQLTEARVPRLAPGESALVELRFPAPAEPGAWVLLVDARTDSDKRASSLGIPPLQVRLETIAPAPAPSPSSSASLPAP